MERGSIKALARKVFAATRRSISPYDICLAYCKDHGWHVVLMGDGGHGDKILELLGLSEYARGKRAFCYRGLTTQIIAVDSSLPHRQRAFCIAHELGHILLGHDLADLRFDDEREADRFAEAFMACPINRIFPI